MSSRRTSLSKDFNLNNSALIPRKIRENSIYREKLIKPKSSSRYGNYFDTSPYTNYSKIKKILGLSDSKYSALSSYKHLKLPTQKILKSPLKDVSTLFPIKKYSILPKLKSYSQDLENSDYSIIEPINLENFLSKKQNNEKLEPKTRKTIISKLNLRNHQNLTNLTSLSNYYK